MKTFLICSFVFGFLIVVWIVRGVRKGMEQAEREFAYEHAELLGTVWPVEKPLPDWLTLYRDSEGKIIALPHPDEGACLRCLQVLFYWGANNHPIAIFRNGKRMPTFAARKMFKRARKIPWQDIMKP